MAGRPGIITEKPTVVGLTNALYRLNRWTQFAINLRGMNYTEIGRIKLEQKGVIERKMALYDTWLEMCPDASWDDVQAALEESKYITLAGELKQKLRKRKTRAGTGNEFEISVKSEITVMNKLEALQTSFTVLALEIRAAIIASCDDSGAFTSNDFISAVIECSAKKLFTSKDLDKGQTLDKLYTKFQKTYHFLDFDVLLQIAEHFLKNKPILLDKLRGHKREVQKFTHTTYVKDLFEKLGKIRKTDPSLTVAKVVIKLHEFYSGRSIDNLQTLVKKLLACPQCDWLNIAPGCVCVILVVPSDFSEHIILISKKKIQFTELLGIFYLKIDNAVIVNEEENKEFSFDSSLLLASAQGNAEAVKVLLELGADQYYVNEHGQTAKELARQNGNEEILRIFESETGTSCCHFAGEEEENEQTLSSLAETEEPPFDSTNPQSGLALTQGGSKNDMQLVISCKNKDLIHAVRKLLEKNANPNFLFRDESALMAACETGSVEVVRLLLSKNAIPDVHNRKGKTALMIASTRGYLELIELLIHEKANPNIRDVNGQTALIFAANNGHLEAAKALVNSESQVNIQMNDKSTALLAACKVNSIALVDLLIHHNANPNLCDHHCWTPLMIASQQGNTQIVELLLAVKDIDIDAESAEGGTALMYGTIEGHISVVKLLLSMNAKVDIQDINGETALMLACFYGNIEIAEKLLQMNADPHIQTDDGRNALVNATHQDYPDIVEMLLAVTQNPKGQMENGQTALIVACAMGHLEVAKKLIACHANIHIQDVNGNNALAHACFGGHVDLVKLLLAEHINVNFPMNKGQTALMFACQTGDIEIVKLLIDNGAGIKIQANNGDTAEMIASRNGHSSISTYLKVENTN